MVSPVETRQKQPETLPADFDGWDTTSDLPANLEKTDAEIGVSDGTAPSETADLPQVALQNAATAQLDLALQGFMPTLSESESNYLDSVYGVKPISGAKKIRMIVAIITIFLVLLLVCSFYFMLRRSQVAAPVQTAAIQRVAMNSQPTSDTATVPNHEQTATPQGNTTATATPVNARPFNVQTAMMNEQLNAPRKISADLKKGSQESPAPASGFGTAGMEGLGSSGNGMASAAFAGQNRSNPRVEMAPKVSISAGVASGLLIRKTTPLYPIIAKNARVSGTVVLQARISSSGTIKDLRVVSGSAMLQQSALDAVRTWRYKPYMLNNQPVEVETTVNVVFTLGN
jgi:TonB family protein